MVTKSECSPLMTSAAPASAPILRPGVKGAGAGSGAGAGAGAEEER